MKPLHPHIVKRPQPLHARLVLGLVATGLIVSGCGGNSPTSSANRPTTPGAVGSQFVAFAVCMRSHGIPSYPDPQIVSAGNHMQITISPGSADPNSPAFKSAGHACHNLMPDDGKPVNSAGNQAQDLTFANCLRAHGVPNFPDAGRDGVFTLPPTINEAAPEFKRASQACMNLQPSSLSIDQTPPGS